jgi:protocatechuate 3,4-dioxygenase beta subunit
VKKANVRRVAWWALWGAGLLVLAGTLGAQAPGAVAPGSASAGVSLQGRVLNAQTGEPLGKAEIRLTLARRSAETQSSSFGARTSADGAFAMDGVSPGDYFVSVSRRAYAVSAAELRGFPSPRPQGRGWLVTLRAGQSLRGLEILLPPAGVITGRVVDEEGEAMTGVVLEASQYRYIQGAKALVPVGRATTDDRGIYRVYDLAPGRYFVKAQGRSLRSRMGMGMRGAGGMGGGPFGGGAFGGGMGGPGGMLEEAGGESAYPETFYPNALSATEAIPLQLAPGAEMGAIDFALTPSATFSVSGTVSLPEGAVPAAAGGGPGAVVFVTARRADQPGVGGDSAGMTPANPRTGEFAIRGLMPGDYQLIARVNSRRGGGSTAVGVARVLVGSASVNGVTIAVEEDVKLPGKVVLPAGATSDQLSKITVIPERRLSPMRTIARVSPEGTFDVTLSPAEAPRLSVSLLPEGFYVKRITVGGNNLLTAEPVSSATLAGTLQVELANDGATLAGTVRDNRGGAVSGARVTLIPAASFATVDSLARNVWKKTTTAGEDGTFQLTAVAPGRYRLFAFESLDADPSYDPDFLSNFGQRWKEIEVKPRENATVELAPIPALDTAMYLESNQ